MQSGMEVHIWFGVVGSCAGRPRSRMCGGDGIMGNEPVFVFI